MNRPVTTPLSPPSVKLIVEESEFIYCDMQDVLRYLRRRDPATALRFVQAFKATVAQLATMPGLGRPRADLAMPEVRSWRGGSFRHYLLFYEILPDRLRLLRLLHGYRDLQSELQK